MMKITNNGPFYAPNKSRNCQISGPYESYKTSLRSKAKIELKKHLNDTFEEDNNDIKFNSDKNSKKEKNKITKKEKKNIQKKIKDGKKNEIKENKDKQTYFNKKRISRK